MESTAERSEASRGNAAGGGERERSGEERGNRVKKTKINKTIHTRSTKRCIPHLREESSHADSGKRQSRQSLSSRRRLISVLEERER